VNPCAHDGPQLTPAHRATTTTALKAAAVRFAGCRLEWNPVSATRLLNYFPSSTGRTDRALPR
jgi:hypothetical protein